MDVKKDPGKGSKVLIALTVIMTIVFVVSLLTLLVSLRVRTYDEPYRVNSFTYYLRDGKYAELIDAWHENVIMGADSAEYAPYYAMAQYCEYATYYKIYAEKGDEEKCKEILSDMKELIPGLKETGILVDEVNNTFGVPKI